MRAAALLLALSLALILVTPASAMVTLQWTNPSFNNAVDDSGSQYCGAEGDSLHDLLRIRIYRQLITGGPARVVDSLDVRGREGLGDSMRVDEVSGAWFYGTFVDTTGRNESCPTNRVYRGPITSVPVAPVAQARPERIRWFDVRGRLVNPVASGIYFWRAYYMGGRVESGKGPPILK